MVARVSIVCLILLLGGGAVWWVGGRSFSLSPSRADRRATIVRGDETSASARSNGGERATGPRPADGLSIFGRVLDAADGTPVVNAQVSAFDHVRGDVERTVTDGEGAFSIAPAGDHAFQLVVRSGSHATHTSSYVRPGREPLVIRVGSGGSIGGQVVDPEGVAVPGAEVTAVRQIFPDTGTWDAHVALNHQAIPEELLRIARVKSGPDGTFLFERLAPAEYVLIATASGHAPVTFNGGERLDHHQGIRVERGERTSARIVLPRLAPVRLRVVDAKSGQPVRGVRITVRVQVGRRSIGVPTPDARELESGLYELDIARQADGRLEYVHLHIEHPRFAPVDLHFGGQIAGHEFRVVLGAGGRVEGTVVGSVAGSVAGKGDTVVVVKRVVDGILLASVPVDSEGRFSVGPFAAKIPIVLFVYDRTMRNFVALVPIVPLNDRIETVTIGDPAAPSLSGRAFKQGRAAPGTLVALTGGGQRIVVFTGADGRYRFDNLNPGSYHVFLNYEDQVYLDRTVDVGAGPARLVTDARYAIDGVLIDSTTNEPVTGSKSSGVSARRVDPAGFRSDTDSTRVRDGGRFRLYVTSPGTWQIDAAAFQVENMPQVQVGKDRPVPEVKLFVRRDSTVRTIEVAILDADSKLPVAEGDYTYVAGSSSGMGRWEAGAVIIDEVRTGSCAIRIDSSIHVPANLTLKVGDEDRRIRKVVELVRADSVRIVEVMDGGAAKPAGVRGGDVLLRYGAARVRNLAELGKAIRAARGTVVLELRRDGRPLSITLAAGRMGAQVENHRMR